MRSDGIMSILNDRCFGVTYFGFIFFSNVGIKTPFVWYQFDTIRQELWYQKLSAKSSAADNSSLCACVSVANCGGIGGSADVTGMIAALCRLF